MWLVIIIIILVISVVISSFIKPTENNKHNKTTNDNELTDEDYIDEMIKYDIVNRNRR